MNKTIENGPRWRKKFLERYKDGLRFKVFQAPKSYLVPLSKKKKKLDIVLCKNMSTPTFCKLIIAEE